MSLATTLTYPKPGSCSLNRVVGISEVSLCSPPTNEGIVTCFAIVAKLIYVEMFRLIFVVHGYITRSYLVKGYGVVVDGARRSKKKPYKEDEICSVIRIVFIEPDKV